MESNLLAEITPLRRKLIDNLQVWRALGLEDIKEVINYDRSERSFRRFLLRTKKIGLISSIRVGPNRRTCYFLNKSVHAGLVESQGPVSDKDVYHDVLASKFVMSFIKLYETKHFNISPSIVDDGNLVPDASLRVEFPSGLKKIAVEMELTRKSIKRYLAKFHLYRRSSDFDLALYVFNDQGIFNSYKEQLKANFGDLQNCKIILILNSSLSLSGINMNQSRVFAFGEEIFLDDIFKRNKKLQVDSEMSPSGSGARSTGGSYSESGATFSSPRKKLLTLQNYS